MPTMFYTWRKEKMIDAKGQMALFFLGGEHA